MEVLPDLRGTVDDLTTAVQGVVVPSHKITQLKEELDLCDSVKNRLALARAYMDCRQYPQATETLKVCRDGWHGDDPEVLSLMAQSFFCQEDYLKSKETLLSLDRAPQKFSRQEDHLLYAVVLQKLGEKEAALKEYETLSQSYVGEEARCRHALFLKSLGRTDEAQKIFAAIIKNCKISPPFYRQEHKQWLETAQKELKAGSGKKG